MAKRAFVLAGGGSRGSYQVGIWRALRELGWEFDIVTGTSVGALNGALAVQGDFDAAVQMWESISTTDVLHMDVGNKIESLQDFNAKLSQFMSEMAKNGGADPRPLEDILRRCIEEERIRASPVDFAIVTVEYPSFTPRIIGKDNLPKGELVDYLMASAACFPAMKMRQIGATKYIDGGYYDNMPVQLAIDRGATEIVAVDLEAIGVRRKTPKHDGVRVHQIRSRWDLGMFLLFDKDTAKRNMRLGYLDALKAFGRVEGDAYAFYRGEGLLNAQRLGPAFSKLCGTIGITVQKYSSLTQEAGKNARLARLIKAEAARAPSPAAIVAAGETAARIFQISPLETYTFEEFNHTLLTRTKLIGAEQLTELEQALSSAKTARDYWEALRLIDHALVAAFFITELRRVCGGEQRLLPLLAAVAPDAFLAAMYLYALETLSPNSGAISPPSQ